MTKSVSADDLKIEFQPLPDSTSHPAGLAWGALSLWIGETLIWSQADEDGIEKPVEWAWVDFLEGVGRIWPWLTLEENYPIPITPEHPGRIDSELTRRWDNLSSTAREEEEDLMFDFYHRHNLSLLLRGISLPPLIFMREGNEFVIWSPLATTPARVPFNETLKLLNSFGDYLCSLISDSHDPLSELARKRWGDRLEKSASLKTSVATGLDDEELKSLFLGSGDITLPERPANDDIYADSEIYAAARMTTGRITVNSQIEIIKKINSITPRPTPILDEISTQTPDAAQYGGEGYSQGYGLAAWLRNLLGFGTGRIDPDKILTEWNVEIADLEMDPAICAVAVWGKDHGPGVIINSKKPARSSSQNGRRATLAHEICHLIYDRQRSLPVADVLGGLGPKLAEKRANAFAAEFLLPRSLAAEALTKAGIEATEAAYELEKKYKVSREIVVHQILNSSLRDTLSRQERTKLETWASNKPGFSVSDA